MRRTAVARFHCMFFVLVACMANATPVRAQVPEVDFYTEGRNAYNAGSFTEAETAFVSAVQADPSAAASYLALARTKFRVSKFDEAVILYDYYLNDFAASLPANLAPRDRIDRVRLERDSANSARSNSEAAPTFPETQQQARAALVERLESGVAVTSTGGGAVSIFQTLLRSGYARPDLAELRRRLLDKILSEARSVTPLDSPVVPSLGLSEWQTQCTRADAFSSLASADDPHAAEARALGSFCQGQLAFMSGATERAVELFSAANEARPSSLSVQIAVLNALASQPESNADAQSAALDAFADTLAERAPGQSALVELYRAIFEAKSGNTDAATRLFIGGLHGADKSSR